MISKQMTPSERARVFKALADPRRVEIVEQLAKGSQCGTTLAERLGISMSLLSHHWEVLVQAGILRKERQGQLRICTLDCERLREALTMGGAWKLFQISPVPAPRRLKARRVKEGAPTKRLGRPPVRKPKPTRRTQRA